MLSAKISGRSEGATKRHSVVTGLITKTKRVCPPQTNLLSSWECREPAELMMGTLTGIYRLVLVTGLPKIFGCSGPLLIRMGTKIFPKALDGSVQAENLYSLPSEPDRVGHSDSFGAVPVRSDQLSTGLEQRSD